MFKIVPGSNISRQTTRKEWRELWRYSRITTKLMQKELERHQGEFDKAFMDLMVYGHTTMRVGFKD